MPNTKKVVVVEEIAIDPEVKEIIAEEKKDEVKKEEVKKEEVKNDILLNESHEPQDVEEDKPNYLWIIIPTALLVGALAGGLITYFSGMSKINDSDSKASPVATISATSNESPTPTPMTDLKRSDLKLQVLNGSSTSGLAGKAKTYLEGLGYKDVAIGNADSSNFALTEIQIKDAKKDFLAILKADLSKNYTLASDTATLSSTSKFDVVITLGKK